jgi:hypothetical protein
MREREEHCEIFGGSGCRIDRQGLIPIALYVQRDLKAIAIADGEHNSLCPSILPCSLDLRYSLRQFTLEREEVQLEIVQTSLAHADKSHPN